MCINTVCCDNNPHPLLSWICSVAWKKPERNTWIGSEQQSWLLHLLLSLSSLCAVELMCYFIDGQRNRIITAANMLQAKNTWRTLEQNKKTTQDSIFTQVDYKIDSTVSVLFFIPARYLLDFFFFFLIKAPQLFPCTNMFFMFSLAVHLVLYSSPVLSGSAVIMTSPGVCIQLTKQFFCSVLDKALGHAIILNQ